MPTLKELKSQHRNIIQMAFNGYKNQEIAERLGMAQSTISTIIRSPLGQAYMNGLQDRSQEATLDVRKKLVSLNKDALNTISRLLDPKEKAPHSVQFSAAKDVLDRTGYKAPDRLNVDMTFQTKTDEELDAEISAIEASVKRINGTNLPKVESHQVCESQNLSPAPIDRSPNLFAHTASVLPSIVGNDDDLSLEDSLNDEDENYFFSFEAEENLEEIPTENLTPNYKVVTESAEINNDEEAALHFEDLELLNNLSFDPFNNIHKG